MGQKIELKTTQFGKNVIFDLNRSLSGQDGETYHNIAHASLSNEISAQLAMKLFQYSNDIENIFIQSNVVTVNFTKNMGTAIKEFEKQIEDFFLFYGDEEEGLVELLVHLDLLEKELLINFKIQVTK